MKQRADPLSEAKHESVRQAVLARQPRTITKFQDLLERFCLEELARQRGSARSPQ